MTGEYQHLLSQLYDYETGEVNEIIQAKLDLLEPSIEKKCISVTHYIKKLESEKREIDELKIEVERRQRAYEKEIDKYQSYLKVNMEKRGINEIKCPYFTIRLRKNPYSTKILDEKIIPEQFIKVKEKIIIDAKPDKTAIKEEVLRTGIQVPGAYVSKENKLEVILDKY
jgi:hypothetical protein